MNKQTLERWTSQQASELYGVSEWSEGFFSISPDGEVLVTPEGASGPAVSLLQIIKGLRERGLDMPVLLRFRDILKARIAMLNRGFLSAMEEAGYRGGYRGVYPIKVNQQEHVVDEILRFGRPFHHGLEVGSKPELIAALAYLDDPEAMLICNGYKDEEFISLALYGLKMGLNLILVAEMPGEVSLILKCARAMEVEPKIGIRVKLSSRAGGHWNESGGDQSRFGLSTSQLVDVLDCLREQGALSYLVMLHYHLGSQIPNIRSIRTGVYEACRVYAGLVREGAAMGILDVGGGLAVDYDGSKTNYPSSRNYTIEEYCGDVIESVMQVMDEMEIPHPLLISESGRATVAHHAVLLFNILDAGRFESHPLPEKLTDDEPDILHSLYETLEMLTAKNVQECFNDATFYRDEIRSLFVRGSVTLRQRGLGEQIFWRIVNRIARLLRDRKYIPEELEGLESSLSDVYYGNFSVFQSLPDSWAIDHLFPIMPIHRLSERPTRNATLADITCDSDGKITRFIDLHDVRRALPVHELRENEEYYLGAFLVGAYQETLGDLHNLLGDTNVAGIMIKGDGEIEFTREIEGDSVSDVLSFVEYDPKELLQRVRGKAERAVQDDRITAAERRRIMNAYQAGLRGYTYFESE